MFKTIPILMSIFFATVCHAEIFSWTDENGVKHFSNKVPPSTVSSGIILPEIKGRPGRSFDARKNAWIDDLARTSNRHDREDRRRAAKERAQTKRHNRYLKKKAYHSKRYNQAITRYRQGR